MSFEYSTTVPWFLFNETTFGFNTDKIFQELQEKGYIKLYNDGSAQYLKAVQDIVNRVIDVSVHYQDKEVKNPAKRFQIIINGSILEIFLLKAEVFNLTRNSDPLWLINSDYETGPDFTSELSKGIEAKVYYSEESMAAKIEEANKGNPYIFHNADFVCCYLITTNRYLDSQLFHYQWLQRVNGKYEIYNNINLDTKTRDFMPAQLPLCRCTETLNGAQWEIDSFYSN